MIKICKQCGKEFNSMENATLFCGKKCFHKSITKRVKSMCLVCGKEFVVTKTRIGIRNHCSLKCGHISRRTKINAKCIVCGKDFPCRPDNIKRGGGKFCSRNCFGVWESINRTGPNSATWKGGITPIRELIRNSRRYRIWRNAVIGRDGSCVKCGCSIKLCAHHKHKFHKHIEAIRIKFPLLSIYESAMLYEPLWDINNGITLCELCHHKEHKWKTQGRI